MYTTASSKNGNNKKMFQEKEEKICILHKNKALVRERERERERERVCVCLFKLVRETVCV